MGPKELRKSGEALFGQRWQTDLARALDVDSRRIRQWIKGERPLPKTIDQDILALLKQRQQKISQLLEDFENSE
jgi:hypothetical protein